MATYATYDVDGVVKTTLLSMTPIVYDNDDSHNAATHQVAIETVLGFFGKTISNVAFLIGDNCNVNRKLDRLIGVPLVGCASHRLNLVVRLLTDEYEAELSTVQKLMIKLRTLNQAAKLRYVVFLNSNFIDLILSLKCLSIICLLQI